MIQHEITAGAMIASSILMSRALSPMEQAIGTWRSAMSARNAYKRLWEIDRIVKQDESDMPLPRPKGHFEFTGLAYRHHGATEPVLSSISLSIPPVSPWVSLAPLVQESRPLQDCFSVTSNRSQVRLL